MKVTINLTIGDNAPEFSAFIKHICFGADKFTFAVSAADRLVRLIDNSINTKNGNVRCWCILECEISSRKISIDETDFESSINTVEILGFINDFQDKMKSILAQDEYRGIGMEINQINIQ